MPLRRCTDAGLNRRFATGNQVGVIVTEQRGSDQLEEFQLSNRERASHQFHPNNSPSTLPLSNNQPFCNSTKISERRLS